MSKNGKRYALRERLSLTPTATQQSDEGKREYNEATPHERRVKDFAQRTEQRRGQSNQPRLHSSPYCFGSILPGQLDGNTEVIDARAPAGGQYCGDSLKRTLSITTHNHA